jgi:GNAT superfamily N-acetyltransferase
MEVKIRKATMQDLKSIVKLAKKLDEFHIKLDGYYGIYYDYENHEEFYKKNLSDKNKIYYIASVDGKDVAFGGASFIDIGEKGAPKIGKMIANFVMKKYRGLGIGKKLVKKRESWLKKNGVDYIETTIDFRNKENIENFKKGGYEKYQIKMLKRINK